MLRRGIQSLARKQNIVKQSKEFAPSLSMFTKRNVVSAEEEMAAENKKSKFVRELIAKVLSDPRNETQITPELRTLSAFVTNKKEYIDAMFDATRIAAQLKFAGVPDVGYLNKNKPVRVAVTGAAGQIGYSLIPRILNGELFGPLQPVILHLIELPAAIKALEGVVMEVEDCAFPLCRGVVATSDLSVGFKDVDYVFLVGAKPRGPGMQRADLLKDNAKIFQEQGKALNDYASKDALVLVVGNPANTNALTASLNAPKLAPTQFSALMRLDLDRAIAQVAKKAQVGVSAIDKIVVWGNHSLTQYPDLSYATINGQDAKKVINDEKWISDVFVPTVQKRGAAIIEARQQSSAASAADASIRHMRDWALGTNGNWTTMAVPAEGNYGIKDRIYAGLPVICKGDGKYEIVKDLKVEAASKQKIDASVKELLEEKAAVAKLTGAK